MTHHPRLSRRAALGLLGTAPLGAATVLAGSGTGHAVPATDSTLDVRIQEIINRPEFGNARWGMKFFSPNTNEPIYSIAPEQVLTPGSSAKVFTEGTVFTALGPDHRFRTRVYRTGPVSRGTLKGDLVLVASGDLLLGGRIRPDGTVVVPSPDHSYGSHPPVPGDPLRVLRDLAGQVVARGIRRIDGHVVVDDSLFRTVHEEIGTGGGPVPISPVMVNDNIVDVTVSPGGEVGALGVLDVSPRTAYVTIVNEVTTIANASAARKLTFVDDVSNPDGTRTVRLTGDVPLGGENLFRAYFVPEPVRFAALAFAEVLRDRGVDATANLVAPPAVHPVRHQVAEHVSPPLSEAVKVMLKASSNLHTVMFPHLVGAIAGGDPDNPEAVYEQFQRRLFEQAGVDPDAGYSSDFFIAFLTHIRSQPYYRRYRDALPVMGRDGSLADVQPDSPAAGHVYAKTGSGQAKDGNVGSKALAGYIELPNGHTVTFAEFAELASPDSLDLAGEAMGEIVTAVYETLA